ncbi:MAG: hypothetical protein JWO31_2793 [Phycisphaerales bacterium]|nr:hypothetical protein [Phycisphaerales bacterium]
MGGFGCLGLFLFGVLSIPCFGLLAPLGMMVWNELWNSGSANGPAAVERAAGFIGPINGGQWKGVATDAQATWTAPDFHGDNTEYVGFTLPLTALTAFEQGLAAANWAPVPATDNRAKSSPERMPSVGSGEPAWYGQTLEDAVFYHRGLETIGVSRKTARVLFLRFES